MICLQIGLIWFSTKSGCNSYSSPGKCIVSLNH